MYRFRKTAIPQGLEISDIMQAQNGLESRFGNRFQKYAGTSKTFTDSVDVAGQAISDLRDASGMITEQQKAVNRLFLMSEKCVQAITDLEIAAGTKKVDNIPLPSDNIRAAYGKKMGYVSLCISFLSEGMLHFMEETINLEEALKTRDNTISKLAAQIPTLETIGAFEEISLADLSGVKPIDVTTYKADRQEKPVSPVINGHTKGGKKKL